MIRRMVLDFPSARHLHASEIKVAKYEEPRYLEDQFSNLSEVGSKCGMATTPQISYPSGHYLDQVLESVVELPNA